MKAALPLHKFVVAAFAAGLALAVAAGPGLTGPKEDAAELDRLFTALKEADKADAGTLESDIWRLWSRSGSPAMDLLLERSEKAIAQGDYEAALDHLTALTDHAPDFAEGWNQRAIVWFHLGRFGQSVDDIRRTLALNPRHFAAMVGFAAILEAMERPEQALEVYRAALAIHPHLEGVDEAVKRLEAVVAGQDI